MKFPVFSVQRLSGELLNGYCVNVQVNKLESYPPEKSQKAD